MSKWRSESALVTRYLGSGVLNSVVGIGVIFVLMAWGMSPLLANISGYFVGFVLGFVVSKKFVFRSNGNFVAENVRYLAAFVVSFLFNVLILRLALNAGVGFVASQFAAAMSYTVLMYLLTRLFVFKIRNDKARCG